MRIRSAASGNLKMGQRAAVPSHTVACHSCEERGLTAVTWSQVITGTIDSEVRDTVNAYVVFAEAADAKTAVSKGNGAVAFGRHLRVDKATRQGESNRCDLNRRIWWENIPALAM